MIVELMVIMVAVVSAHHEEMQAQHHCQRGHYENWPKSPGRTDEEREEQGHGAANHHQPHHAAVMLMVVHRSV